MARFSTPRPFGNSDRAPTPDEMAAYLGISPRTLRWWQSKGHSPDFLPFDHPDRLMTHDEVAAYLGIAPRTLRTWRSKGQFPLPDILQGKSLRWRKRTVDAWIDEQSNPAA